MTVLPILLTYTDTVACSVPTLWQIWDNGGGFGEYCSKNEQIFGYF